MNEERRIEIAIEDSLGKLLGGDLHQDQAKLANLREFLWQLTMWIDIRADRVGHPEHYD